MNNKTPKYSVVVVKLQENYLNTHTQQQQNALKLHTCIYMGLLQTTN